MLRYGTRLRGMKNTYQIWLTCSALHDWLLKVDGLVKGWEHGVQSDWETTADTQAHDLQSKYWNHLAKEITCARM